MMSAAILKPDPYDAEWREFCDELADAVKLGCTRRPHFAALLLAKRGCDVEVTLALYETHGGYCDCEILLNVDRLTLEEELAMWEAEREEAG
jgi:Protein of unknown function (DUF2695)